VFELGPIDLKIEPGEFVAICGASGAGKTTILKLLSGAIRPSTGHVYLDDLDMTQIHSQSLSKAVSVSFSNKFVDGKSIQSYLRGNKDASINDIWDAFEKVCIKDEILALPMTLNTPVSANNTHLSGGQMQRLVLAKAIINKPKVLLLDEPTSSLDQETEFKVVNNLKLLSATKVVVAHRLTNLQAADRIIVMKKGKIVESGEFQELLRLDRVFAQLYRSTLKGEENEK
jgi:ABC-type bacteriocin/lantibiotic exporter with double-glycine peptidase domain